MSKSIPELRKELDTLVLNQQLKKTYKEGLKSRKSLERNIFRLKHPSVNAAYKLKSHLGSNIGKVAQYVKKNAKSKNQPIQSHPHHVKHKTIYTRKLIKNKQGHYVPKYVAKKVKVHSTHKVKHQTSNSDPFGLSNVWRLPKI